MKKKEIYRYQLFMGNDIRGKVIDCTPGQADYGAADLAARGKDYKVSLYRCDRARGQWERLAVYAWDWEARRVVCTPCPEPLDPIVGFVSPGMNPNTGEL